MKSSSIQFIVNGTVVDQQRHVIGRCGDAPIHVGDVFDSVVCYQHRKYPEEVGQPAIPLKETPVALRVAHIHAYDTCLEELGQGMTGSLVLDGDGFEYVADGAVLESSRGS